MLSSLLYLNFCSGWIGAAKSSANPCFHFAPAENCFGQPPLDLSICYQFAPVLIFAWGGWAPRVHARINVSTLRLRRRIAFQNLSQIALHALSLCCLNFRSGWMGAANSSATHCVNFAPAANCFETPLLDPSICCQFSSVLISARGGWTPKNHHQK